MDTLVEEVVNENFRSDPSKLALSSSASGTPGQSLLTKKVKAWWSAGVYPEDPCWQAACIVGRDVETLQLSRRQSRGGRCSRLWTDRMVEEVGCVRA